MIGLNQGAKSEFSWRDTFFGIGGWIFLLIIAIFFVGIMFIYSSSYRVKTDSYLPYANKQLLWGMVTLVFFAIFVFIDYNLLLKYSFLIYIAGINLLLVTAVIGHTAGGAKSWLKFGSVSFQTSDFMKIGIILFLAKILTDSPNRKRQFTDLFLPFIITGVPSAIILVQPDLGTTMLLVPVLFAMLFAAGSPVRHLVLVILLIATIILPAAYVFGLKDYQKKRVLMFVFQEQMTQEEKRGSGYHLEQSKIAHGSGGWTGKGYQKGTQNVYGFLPERHTDFIFSVIGEEFGLIGTCGVLLLYFLLFASMLFAAYTSLSPSGQLVIVGITTMLTTQTMINTCMTVGLAPITGLPLPFLSYGGTSLLFCGICVALVLSIKGHKVHVVK